MNKTRDLQGKITKWNGLTQSLLQAAGDLRHRRRTAGLIAVAAVEDSDRRNIRGEAPPDLCESFSGLPQGLDLVVNDDLVIAFGIEQRSAHTGADLFWQILDPNAKLLTRPGRQ